MGQAAAAGGAAGAGSWRVAGGYETVMMPCMPAVLWPWNLVGRGLPELLVACVYLATVGLFYLAASRRSAPRSLKSTYPDNH